MLCETVALDFGLRQMVDGGAPGHSGTSIAVGPNDAKHVVAVKGRILYLYSLTDTGIWTRRLIDRFASFPDIAADAGGKLHIAYADTWNDALKYASNATGKWKIETVDSQREVGQGMGY